MVPKIVVCLLINRAKDEIQSELVHRLYSSIANVDTLLRGACRARARGAVRSGAVCRAPLACSLAHPVLPPPHPSSHPARRPCVQSRRRLQRAGGR